MKCNKVSTANETRRCSYLSIRGKGELPECHGNCFYQEVEEGDHAFVRRIQRAG